MPPSCQGAATQCSSGGLQTCSNGQWSSAIPCGPHERCAVTAVFFGSGLGIGAWAASVPTFKDRFALSDGALSIALLAFAAGAVVSMPLAGLLAPRFGAARLIRLTALLFAATLLLPPLAWSLTTLVVAVFAMGAGQGSLDVAMNAGAPMPW